MAGRGLMFRRLIVAVVAALAIAFGLFGLHNASSGLSITETTVNQTPVTIFRQTVTAPRPVVVIAHGFAGSQQLMQPFAETLARNGYVAVTFDFLGHGRNPIPMRGDLAGGETITAGLLKELDQVASYARALPGSDGQMAVLGHSMASDIVIRFAQAHPDVQATVVVSVFSPVVTATSPRNLLVIVGALEPSMLRNEGLRIVNQAAGGNAVADETYGNFADGTARRLVWARGVEHIGVLYSHDSMAESLHWMNASLGRHQAGFIDSRGRWLALTFLGIIALAWPLSSLLPIAAAWPLSSLLPIASLTPTGANLAWKPLLIAAIAPALLTPLVLWKLPTGFLPILLGDYLALHFLLYGTMTAALLFYFRRETPDPSSGSGSWRSVAVGAIAIAGFDILAFGLPLDAYVFSFLPIPARFPLIVAVACGTFPYFIADEWLTRGARARLGAYPLTKFCFLLSLGLAVALNPMKLFFLVIIVPAILLLFLTFGLISRWSYHATRHPLPAAIANATVFAWAISVTFPMIVR